MAIANANIIQQGWAALVMDGLIKPEEEIHTFQGWKDRGYRVKRGEHAITRLTIWKYAGKKDKETEEETDGHCFLKNSCFFATSQVERAR